VETDQREQQRQHAEAARERGQKALGGERAVDLVVQSAEPEDRQPGVVLADQAADGGNGLLGSAANLDIESSAGVVVFEEREKDLLGFITDTAIADVGDGTGVALVEIAAGEEANAEGGEETGAHGVEVDGAIAHDAAIGLDGRIV